MPPKCLYTRQEIIETAVQLVQEEGMSALTARALAGRLGCSVKPIFGLFQGMEDVQAEVLLAANQRYCDYLRIDMESGKYPPYKASGMAYIRFAREQRELFKILFMRDRSREKIREDRDSIRQLLDLIQQNLHISEDEANLFHMEMWIYVHGIATMIATSYLDWDEPTISRVLTDAFIGLKYRYQGENANVCNTN